MAVKSCSDAHCRLQSTVARKHALDKSDEAYVFPAGRASERKFPVVYLSRPWNARTLPLVLLLQCELFSQAGSKISLFLDWFEE